MKINEVICDVCGDKIVHNFHNLSLYDDKFHSEHKWDLCERCLYKIEPLLQKFIINLKKQI